MSGPHRSNPSEPRPPRARAPRAHPVGRRRRVRPEPAQPSWTPGVGVLRRPAHGERSPRHPPRVGPAVQGPLSPLSHDARQARRAQGRLGLPRPARGGPGREGARVLGQARDRGLRDRALQREVPLVGAALRRGLAIAHEPHRHVARHRRRVLDALERIHRERVVAVPRDVGQGRHLRGLQGRPVLRPLRHRALEPRARPARRVPRRHRAVGLRALPVDRPRRRSPRVDDHAVDAALERRCRGRPARRLRTRARPRRRARSRHGARPRRPRCSATTRRSSGDIAAADLVGAHYEPPFTLVPVDRRRIPGRRRRLRHRRGRLRHRAPRARPSARSTARSASARVCPPSTR